MKYIVLSYGWYDLEYVGEEYFRWNTDKSELLIYSNEFFDYIEFKIYANRDNIKITFSINDSTSQSFTLNTGRSSIRIKLCGTDRIKIISSTFTPKEVEPNNTDDRLLGFRVYSMKLISKIDIDYSIEDIPTKVTDNRLLENYNDNNIKINRSDEFGTLIIDLVKNNSDGKLNLINQLTYSSHRSGWYYAITSLKNFHNSSGVAVEGFLERPFYFELDKYKKEKLLPFTSPWIGFMHNPYNMPKWFLPKADPQSIFDLPEFQESLLKCKGIYTLSESNARLIKNKLPEINVDWLYHPTEFPYVIFDYNRFIRNEYKQVINIGWWLRKYYSIFLLKVDSHLFYKKRLLPINTKAKYIQDLIKMIQLEEQKILNIKLNSTDLLGVSDLEFQNNDEYDRLLSENIVFVDLYDSCANNVIIECMARYTPILVNRLPSTIDYLGEDYPFYFDTLKDASNKLHDLDLIKETTEYLKQPTICDRVRIHTFLNKFENSNIYKSV